MVVLLVLHYFRDTACQKSQRSVLNLYKLCTKYCWSFSPIRNR